MCHIIMNKIKVLAFFQVSPKWMMESDVQYIFLVIIKILLVSFWQCYSPYPCRPLCIPKTISPVAFNVGAFDALDVPEGIRPEAKMFGLMA